MKKGKIILERKQFGLTIDRLCHQLIEEHETFKDTCLIGIQKRGVFLSNRIYDRLKAMNSVEGLKYGKLDITFFRDDFRIREEPLKANKTELDFLVDGKKVILIDDVLFTGRSVQAALTALNHFGRPKTVELLVLVDRRFNRHLPIQPDYTGYVIDALDRAYVKVDWVENEGVDQILMFEEKQAKKL